MTRRLLFGCLLAGLLLLAGAPPAMAQGRVTGDTDRTGTAGASYLLVPVTARTASLGAAVAGGLADMHGIEAGHYNPAALTLNSGTGVLFSRMNYVADIGINFFGVAQQFGNNNIALTVNSWDFGDIPLTTEADPEVSDVTFSAQYIVVGLSYARLFTDRIAAGLTVKGVSQSIAQDLDAQGISFDGGMTYTVGETGLRFGVSLRNYAPSMAFGGDGLNRNAVIVGQDDARSVRLEADDFELPSVLNFGASYVRNVGGQASVAFLGNFTSNAYEEDQYSGGLEVGLMNMLFVRGGYMWQQDLGDNFYTGLNAGAGLNLDVMGTSVTVDYAYRSVEFFDAVQLITASVTL